MFYCFEHVISAGRTSKCIRTEETCATERMFEHIRLRDKFDGLQTTQCEATPVVSCFAATNVRGESLGNACYKNRKQCEESRSTFVSQEDTTNAYSPCFPFE